MLMGGGIGIPPMLETAKAIQGEKIIVSGYRDELFLTEELNAADSCILPPRMAAQDERKCAGRGESQPAGGGSDLRLRTDSDAAGN